jgi:hypothetical protein
MSLAPPKSPAHLGMPTRTDATQENATAAISSLDARKTSRRPEKECKTSNTDQILRPNQASRYRNKLEICNKARARLPVPTTLQCNEDGIYPTIRSSGYIHRALYGCLRVLSCCLVFIWADFTRYVRARLHSATGRRIDESAKLRRQ